MNNTTNNGTPVYSFKFEGEKYRATKDLNRQAIKKLIAADIKAAQKSGALPAMKVSVTSPDHRSMDAKISATSFAVLSDEYLNNVVAGTVEYNGRIRYSAEATRVITAIEAIVNAYNFDDSDSMTDYFFCRFYDRVTFDEDMEDAERNAYVAHVSDVIARSHEASTQLVAELAAEKSNVIPFRGKAVL